MAGKRKAPAKPDREEPYYEDGFWWGTLNGKLTNLGRNKKYAERLLAGQ